MQNILQLIATTFSFVSALATIYESRNNMVWGVICLVLVAISIYCKNMKIIQYTVLCTAAVILLVGSNINAANKKKENTQLSYPDVSAEKNNEQTNNAVKNYKKNKYEIIILVPPFENVTGVRSEIKIEKKSELDLDSHSIQVLADRYSEAPRTLLEDVLVSLPNVSVVERQQLDKLLLESQYSRTSGIVDQQYAISIGKQLGANAIAMGTIVDISTTDSVFTGYGVKTLTKTTVATVRIRIINISSGRIIFSKTIYGSDKYTTTNFGGNKRDDLAFQAIKNAMESLNSDVMFAKAISNLKK